MRVLVCDHIQCACVSMYCTLQREYLVCGYVCEWGRCGTCTVYTLVCVLPAVCACVCHLGVRVCCESSGVLLPSTLPLPPGDPSRDPTLK